MIKKLRIKLVTVAMLSLLFVLFVIESIVGVLNYGKIIKDADRILNVLGENSGSFPKKGLSDKMENKHFMSPEIPYESRYFSVLLSNDGTVVLADTGRVASIDAEAAVVYAKNVWENKSERGFVDNYRYLTCSVENGVRIIFLDCGRQIDSFQNLVITAVIVSLTGLFSILILMIYLSARIVKPFSDNYEKQKRFITDAGHELKTPLTIIDADTEVLEMDFGENEWLKDIRSQTKRLADLTNAMIFLSRMEEGLKNEIAAEFSLSDMAEDMVSAFQAPAKVNEKVLTANIAPMIFMKGDEKAVRSLLTILLDNAIKYSDEKGNISLSLEKQKNRICLTVFNSAEHISKEQLSHLFDRFYRTDDSRNSQTGGYGLGLSIAAATVAAHKGKITAETKDEKSLKVTVIFPI